MSRPTQDELLRAFEEKAKNPSSKKKVETDKKAKNTSSKKKAKAKADSQGPQTKSEEQIALEIAIKNDESRLQENRRRLEELIRREKEEKTDHDDSDTVCVPGMIFRWWNNKTGEYEYEDDTETVMRSPSGMFEAVIVLVEGRIVKELTKEEAERYDIDIE